MESKINEVEKSLNAYVQWTFLRNCHNAKLPEIQWKTSYTFIIAISLINFPLICYMSH